MVNNNQSVLVKLQPKSMRDIELFVDTICDQLFINDTYYGNILMAITELFNYLLENKHGDSLNITYNSDYKNIEISFQPVDTQAGNRLSDAIDFDEMIHKDSDKNIFLIHSLVDKISLANKDTLSLGFDISALHNEIYNKRAALLTKYFTKQTSEKVQKEND
ncbi:MAG TPA: hypothetical protein QF480_08380 [Bacteroidales bacterium]|jgi:hypothetical protein|nr:hypothetical protein [Bacteroidota bacterium]HJN06618.1 hypothetical protein [Bacteroidales bacterium]|tara:strand:- start:760 stop:1245 length:486 start_codon:yes stop_codon:yes gene_type:complete